jgi:hypothetical protein
MLFWSSPRFSAGMEFIMHDLMLHQEWCQSQSQFAMIRKMAVTTAKN